MTNETGWLRWKEAFEITSTIVVLVVALGIGWKLFFGVGQQERTANPVAPRSLPTEPLSLEGAEIRGQEAARVVLLQFSEFECPYCQRFANETLPVIIDEFVDTGRVRIAFRHLPIESIHPNAFGASLFAHCAGRMGRFWEAHDGLFRLRRIDESARLEVAKTIGIDLPSLRECVDSPTSTSRVREDMKIAEGLGLSGTPIFYVGTVTLDGLQVKDALYGARHVGEFREALERAAREAGR